MLQSFCRKSDFDQYVKEPIRFDSDPSSRRDLKHITSERRIERSEQWHAMRCVPLFILTTQLAHGVNIFAAQLSDRTQTTNITEGTMVLRNNAAYFVGLF